jgi:hypothetical protein
MVASIAFRPNVRDGRETPLDLRSEQNGNIKQDTPAVKRSLLLFRISNRQCANEPRALFFIATTAAEQNMEAAVGIESETADQELASLLDRALGLYGTCDARAFVLGRRMLDCIGGERSGSSR